MLCQLEQSLDWEGYAHYKGSSNGGPEHQRIYFIHMDGDGFTVYGWIRSVFMINSCARGQLCLTLVVQCKWGGSGYSNPWRRIYGSWVFRHCQHLHSDQEKALLSLWASPWAGFANPMGLRHWGRWHSCAHVYSTHSLRISCAPYTFLLP